MFTVSKEVQFDAGHRVPGHAQKCRHPHGHRYRVRITLTGELVEDDGAADEGMVLDFGAVKELLTVHVHDVFDHGFMVWDQDRELLEALGVEDVLDVRSDGSYSATVPRAAHGWQVTVLPYVPTAENVARWVHDRLSPLVEEFWNEVALTLVEVWETPTSCATYRPPWGAEVPE